MAARSKARLSPRAPRVQGELRRGIEAALGTGEIVARIADVRPVGGGCIHRAAVIGLEDGRRRFVKWNDVGVLPMFETEATGLAVLGAPGTIRVPTGPRAGVAGGAAFLVMEAIDEGPRGAGFLASFGRCLAALHRVTAGPRFGFDHDNFIGSTRQRNGWTDDWVAFWRDRRLGFQLDLARRAGRSNVALDRLGDRLMQRLDEWIDLPDEPGCLLHGDLWGGNYVVDEHSAPVLVDPAVYYGHREADLAMTMLFGGFGDPFWDAYRETWPLPPGSEERLEIYKLYHLLNHLNLFGSGYLAGCVAVLRGLVG